MKNFDFDNLFVLDLANNHQGSLKHGLKIIKECSKMVHKHKIRAAIKKIAITNISQDFFQLN